MEPGLVYLGNSFQEAQQLILEQETQTKYLQKQNGSRV